MNWSQAYEQTMSAELWGFIDLSENFTQDTIRKFDSFLIDLFVLKNK